MVLVCHNNQFIKIENNPLKLRKIDFVQPIVNLPNSKVVVLVPVIVLNPFHDEPFTSSHLFMNLSVSHLEKRSKNLFL